MLTATFGTDLRRWREHRGLSQLQLSVSTGVSQRHLSYLENGRSKPSREMVVHLGIALGLPLRDQNSLLIAAGFAHVYGERKLDGPDLAQFRRVLEQLLDAYEPFPAYVIDGDWNINIANHSAANLLASLLPPDAPPDVAGNTALAVFHPRGLRPSISNWTDVARSVLQRLLREVDRHPDDRGLRDLLDAALACPGVAELSGRIATPSIEDLLVPVLIRNATVELSFFTTVATIGSAADVTLEELRIETLLPSDLRTEEYLRNGPR